MDEAGKREIMQARTMAETAIRQISELGEPSEPDIAAIYRNLDLVAHALRDLAFTLERNM